VKLTHVVICLWALVFPATASLRESGAATASLALPNPVLVFMGAEEAESGGKKLMRYSYAVDNRAEYPKEMFAAAPDLPPCGQNTKAARTWVDIYDQGGKRLNGFCALGSSDGLARIWFALDRDAIPPSWVYIEMNDRKTGTKYKSNLADSTM
jgi:hypothetical protein